MTAVDVEKEQTEIEESMVSFDSDRKMKSNRFDKETAEIQRNPPAGVTLLDTSQNTWTLQLLGPSHTVFEGGKFKVLIIC